MWDCSAQLEKEKQIQDKSAFACWMPCVPTGLMAEGLVAGGWGGALPGVLGTGALPALPRGNHGIRSA